jgi:hypothetical protein
MTKRALTLMAVALMAATALTAATAFAGVKPQKCRLGAAELRSCNPPVSQLVADQTARSAQAIALLRIRNLHKDRRVTGPVVKLPR